MTQLQRQKGCWVCGCSPWLRHCRKVGTSADGIVGFVSFGAEAYAQTDSMNSMDAWTSVFVYVAVRCGVHGTRTGSVMLYVGNIRSLRSAFIVMGDDITALNEDDNVDFEAGTYEIFLLFVQRRSLISALCIRLI